MLYLNFKIYTSSQKIVYMLINNKTLKITLHIYKKKEVNSMHIY